MIGNGGIKLRLKLFVTVISKSLAGLDCVETARYASKFSYIGILVGSLMKLHSTM